MAIPRRPTHTFGLSVPATDIRQVFLPRLAASSEEPLGHTAPRRAPQFLCRPNFIVVDSSDSPCLSTLPLGFRHHCKPREASSRNGFPAVSRGPGNSVRDEDLDFQ